MNILSGSFVFNTWSRFIKEAIEKEKLDAHILIQYHDENDGIVHKNHKERLNQIFQEAIDKTNKVCNLNIEIGQEAEYGNNYAEVH